MLNLIPMPKVIEEKGGFLKKKTVKLPEIEDGRVKKAAEKLPLGRCGAKLSVSMGSGGECYELEIGENEINITADGAAGAFYAIQTLRQLFEADEVPCVYIKDKPDFKYRGFYHDVTRGKVPKVETLKKLIDKMAYHKMNELELYVEHTFEFKEYADGTERTGALTAEEIRELDDYCYENFIEFVPSLSTFGHLYELLEKEKYKHLREIGDYENNCMWNARMSHHTIDPTNSESLELIKSLIDQYMPLFKHTDRFNICCDETFDLEHGKHKGTDTGRLYIDFVCKLINYVNSKGKTAMMWGDILLKYPQTISELPENVQLLNWHYGAVTDTSRFEVFKNSGRTQIVCPGTSTWSRFCERVDCAAENISKMAEYGYKYGADGVLNTNWGDYGNPCSLELAMYMMLTGAEKSWSVNTEINSDFDVRVDKLLYKKFGATALEKRLSRLHDTIDYNMIAHNTCGDKKKAEMEKSMPPETMRKTISGAKELLGELDVKDWENDEYRQEMILAAKAIILMAQYVLAVLGQPTEKYVDAEEWIAEYASAWRRKNKESELREIEKMFCAIDKSNN